MAKEYENQTTDKENAAGFGTQSVTKPVTAPIAPKISGDVQGYRELPDKEGTR